MKITTTYKVKIKHYNRIFEDTLTIYRSAVDFLINVVWNEWDTVASIDGQKYQQQHIERLVHYSKCSNVAYEDFDTLFYKMPSYLRRASIADAIGKVSSVKSNKKDTTPRAGHSFPVMYDMNMFLNTGRNTARIKVYMQNTWKWLDVELRESDIRYIEKHCGDKKKLSPTLVKKGKQCFLAFPFTENVELTNKDIFDQKIIAVDLGINNACICTCMDSSGTIYGRHFLKLTNEIDHLSHILNVIKKHYKRGNKRLPHLWGRVKGINKDISIKTAHYIMEIATMYNADVIVFEHLELQGKKKGNKQKIHHWKAKAVQKIVESQAHRLGMRIARVNARNTSKLAYDGSGEVTRNSKNYSICKFTTGKEYNCDLNATYNIGSRYFIRRILESLPEVVELGIEAKVPQYTKRSTCTLSTLLNLNAELVKLA